MLRTLLPFTVVLLSLFFASKAFALDIVRVDANSVDDSAQVRAIETVDGEIIAVNELKNGSSDPVKLMNKIVLKFKNGKQILSKDIEYFYAKKPMLAGRAPKDDGGKGGTFRMPKDDE